MSREESIFLTITGPSEISEKYQDSPWSFVNVVYQSTKGSRDSVHYITTDSRTIAENGWQEDLVYQTKEDPCHHEPRPILSLSSPPKSKWVIDLGEGRYEAFLSDWLEEGSEEVLSELRDHGYNV